MRESLHSYMKVGIVHFMAYPQTPTGEGPIVETVRPETPHFLGAEQAPRYPVEVGGAVSGHEGSIRERRGTDDARGGEGPFADQPLQGPGVFFHRKGMTLSEIDVIRR